LAIGMLLMLAPALRGADGEIEKYVDELPIPPRISVPRTSGTAEITVRIQQLTTQFHRDLPPTQAWGFVGTSPGPTIEVERDQKLRVRWVNDLPSKHILAAPLMMPEDPNFLYDRCGFGGWTPRRRPMPMPTDLPDVRAVTHLHGAAVAQPSRQGRKDNDGWPDNWLTSGQEQIAEYPNRLSSRQLWYHDHAMGTTGRNVAAGLAGMYLIRDDLERSLNLPSGDYEIPLLLQARGLKLDGSLYYTPDIATEFYGNTILANGKLWPILHVEPRKYRFRIVNGSNARSVALRLVNPDDEDIGGPPFYQIGSDGGFLAAPVLLNAPDQPDLNRLTLAPAERADVIIDFSQYAGRDFVLHNNQLDPGDAELPLPDIMMFRVGTSLRGPDTSQIPAQLAPIRRMQPSEAQVTRQMVLDSVPMADGRPMLQINGKSWNDPITERPHLGDTEVWEIVDTLPDAHPFHVHLVQFQILDRRPFDLEEYRRSKTIRYTGPAVVPDANEMGWKDVVRAYPSMVTRIIMKFEPHRGYKGYYVYHCHILEHEDMDMMRPFQVISPR